MYILYAIYAGHGSRWISWLCLRCSEELDSAPLQVDDVDFFIFIPILDRWFPQISLKLCYVVRLIVFNLIAVGEKRLSIEM